MGKSHLATRRALQSEDKDIRDARDGVLEETKYNMARCGKYKVPSTPKLKHPTLTSTMSKHYKGHAYKKC